MKGNVIPCWGLPPTERLCDCIVCHANAEALKKNKRAKVDKPVTFTAYTRKAKIAPSHWREHRRLLDNRVYEKSRKRH